MAYSRVAGHEPIKTYLKQALQRGVLSHAYLFEGRQGVGKLDMAREFAKAVNCRTGGPEACDVCVSCRKADHGSHPDIFLVEPEGRSIKNDQIKAFQGEVHLKPYESRRKVFIIDRADTMTPQAQNSLLKVLEEPPEASLILLVTANREGLLPTVRSRCQRLHFNRIGREGLMEALREQKGPDAPRIAQAAAMADGSLSLARELAADQGFLTLREQCFDLAADLIDKKTGAVLKRTEQLAKLERSEVLKALELLLAWFRDLSIFKETKNGHLIRNHDKMERIRVLSAKARSRALYEAWERIGEAVGHMNGTANQQMVLDHLILNLQEAFK